MVKKTPRSQGSPLPLISTGRGEGVGGVVLVQEFFQGKIRAVEGSGEVKGIRVCRRHRGKQQGQGQGQELGKER